MSIHLSPSLFWAMSGHESSLIQFPADSKQGQLLFVDFLPEKNMFMRSEVIQIQILVFPMFSNLALKSCCPQ